MRRFDPSAARAAFVPAAGRDFLTWLYDPAVALLARERAFKKKLFEQASIPAEGTVLDLGCGTGTLAVRIARAVPGGRVTGFDADESVLRRARRKAERAGAAIRFDLGRAPALPYPDESFDRVVSSLFFHHLDARSKRDTARAAFRVLRPGGELHVADWGRPSGPFMRMLFQAVRALDGFERTADNVEGRLPAIFEEAGFSDVRTRLEMPTPCGTLALYSAVKRASPPRGC